MGSFDSPIGGRKFQGQQMRTFQVPDANEQVDYSNAAKFAQYADEEESLSDYELERKIAQERKEKTSGKKRIEPGSKNRIEMLLGMTRGTKEVSLPGVNFQLKTLSSKETQDILQEAAKEKLEVMVSYTVRKLTLALSITHIESIEFDTFIGASNIFDRVEFVDNLDATLVATLFNEYSLMEKDHKKKYEVKSDEDAVEVFEEIKK